MSVEMKELMDAVAGLIQDTLRLSKDLCPGEAIAKAKARLEALEAGES